jgi:hypothetical protein
MKIKKHTKEEERRLKDEGEFSPQVNSHLIIITSTMDNCMQIATIIGIQ